jgi:hypothetical protein
LGITTSPSEAGAAPVVVPVVAAAALPDNAGATAIIVKAKMAKMDAAKADALTARVNAPPERAQPIRARVVITPRSTWPQGGGR